MKTVTQITNGIKVSVGTEYLKEYSNPIQYHYVFAYKISIENCSDFTIQLLRRHWFIHDSNGQVREVEGEGVVGQQPELEPGQSHQYVSGCNLKTPIGKMNGKFLMTRIMDGKEFWVNVPEFVMTAPYKLN